MIYVELKEGYPCLGVDRAGKWLLFFFTDLPSWGNDSAS